MYLMYQLVEDLSILSAIKTHPKELIQKLLVIQDEVWISDVVDDGTDLGLGQLLGVVGQPAADHDEVVKGHLHLIRQCLHLGFNDSVCIGIVALKLNSNQHMIVLLLTKCQSCIIHS